MKSLNDPMTRMSGAGNSFVVIDFLDNPSAPQILPKHIQEICSFDGVVADGLFVLIKNRQGQAQWQFYNSDGSKPMMCGNAARCATLYLVKRDQFRSLSVSFETLRGPVQGELLTKESDSQGDFLARVTLPEMDMAFKNIQIGGQKYFSINTGVPHIVLRQKPDRELAARLRRSPEFGPEGTNVTFLDKDQAVSFERGVEDFTLACGTGAIAAAAFLKSIEGHAGPAKIQMPGGLLQVTWKNEKQPILTGPARFDGDFVFKKELPS